MGAHIGQRTCHDAHHMVQKALAGEIQHQIGTIPENLNGIHPPDGGFFAVFQITEGLEILLSHQIGGSGAHCLHIQLFRQRPAVPPSEHIGHRALVDAVAVGLTLGIQSGVKPGLGLFQRHHGNIPGQILIDVSHDLTGRQGMFQRKGGHLSHGVHAPIGAARAAHFHLCAVQLLQNGLQLGLNGIGGIALLLPAVIFGSLILKGHTIILLHRPPRCGFSFIIPHFCKLCYTVYEVMTMEYQLIRSKRKTLAIEITRDARLVVRAPLRCSQARIEQFLAEKQAWITLHLQKMQQRRENHPEPTPEEEIFLRQKARNLLPGLVNRYAAQMDVQPTGITITGARTRFGSCSPKNRLSFSFRLMDYPMEAIEYVVVHELAHILHKNHSAAFYAEIEKVLPDWRTRNRLLKQ